MKNGWLFVFFIIMTTACNFTPKEVPNAQEMLRRELHAIDWDRVDQYPTYDSCDTISDLNQSVVCFFEQFNSEIFHVLKSDSIVKLSTIDSVLFAVTINAESELHFETLEINEKLLPKLMMDSIMLYNREQFTEIHPASKRGVPVTTQFQLQINLKED